MQPVGRRKADLGPQGQADDDEADDEDHEDGGAVAGIGPGEVEAAGLAPGTHIEKAFEQGPLAAIGTAAEEP